MAKVSPLRFYFHLLAAEAQSPEVSSLERLIALIQSNITHSAGAVPNNPPSFVFAVNRKPTAMTTGAAERIDVWQRLGSSDDGGIYSR